MRHLLIPPVLAPIGPGSGPAGAVRILGGRIMGTTWSVRLVAPEARDLGGIRDRIEVEFARLLSQLSHWEPDSALCRFNRAPAGTRQALPDDLFTVLSAACALAEAGAGACDPTLGTLVDLWGFGPPGPIDTIPDGCAIAAARSHTGWHRLALDPSDRSAFQSGGLALDLSAIAKGYVVDRISDLLAGLSCHHHLVEIGGELRGRGLKPDRRPWWVGLDDSETGIVVALNDLAVATSGDSRRSLRLSGSRFGHTLDPATGCPLTHAARSVSVLHPSCMIADALATAILVLGPERGLALCDLQAVACCIQSDSGTRFSMAARRMLT